METTKTTTRIHPLMAAAAVSVIVVSLAGTAAITGLLPSSHSAPEAVPMNPAYGATLAPTAAQQGALQAAPVQAAYAQAYPQASLRHAPIRPSADRRPQARRCWARRSARRCRRW